MLLEGKFFHHRHQHYRSSIGHITHVSLFSCSLPFFAEFFSIIFLVPKNIQNFSSCVFLCPPFFVLLHIFLLFILLYCTHLFVNLFLLPSTSPTTTNFALPLSTFQTQVNCRYLCCARSQKIKKGKNFSRRPHKVNILCTNKKKLQKN